jgi:hypothetical protein
VLSLPVLDEALLARLRILRPARELAPETPARQTIVLVVGPLLLLLSTLSMVREIAYTLPAGRGMKFWPRAGDAAMAWVAPLRSINGYGLFRVMTTERPELVLEGSRDGRRWEAYEFRYKPGAVNRRPRFVAPFHPRLDWQLWFAALSPGRNLGWVERLAEALRAGTPEVVALLGHDPFPTTPPQYVRAVLYDYRFSTPEQRRRTGSWWVRTLQGTFVLGSSVADSSGS